ncbi:MULTISPECIES: MBL fold metallo-hydrolase [unclassified Limnohabitans]|uniref:MBL fold metallo-hydrolase RNA specificity domain-containing protein n=1 Tax=unclassified Limnohabitans TaxID=2626134 RepID=UPI000CF20F43|nr:MULTISPECIES: MBL fold metallo-hydrolase [unclassified Limnohabitans]PQA83771.1 MBL fold metallo-hydrolase [Limnohabitans sp. TS-CS-82]BDU55819.1 MBL fold hydrolase [Limnohabitans sp. TEGF004]
MSVNITFLGGTGTVTGSKYLVQHDGKKLLVDCGLFQGYKQLRLRNWNPMPIEAADVDAVLLTHAHLDHSGYLPLLHRQGFRGRVHATPATCDLCAILLPDSGHIQEEDAAFVNRHGYSKHAPALPLYSKHDAIVSLNLLHPEVIGKTFSPLPGWKATFSSAGHILGAASILLEVGGRRILFSGDLGRPDDLIMKAPDLPPEADTVLIESTYGNRSHPQEDVLAELAPALKRVASRGGVAVLPVFAVGRAQALLYAISLLKERGEIPHSLPIFLDSPMAVHTTELLPRHPDAHRLDAEALHQVKHIATMVETPEQSKALAKRHGPMVILSASGMATGGRVLHHLAHYLPDHRNMVILTGYQAPGTRGDTLAKGGTTVRIHAQEVAVNAEVVQLQSSSAHADATQLLDWLKHMKHAPDQVYVVHGELEASDMLRQRIEHELKWRAVVPEHGSTWPT